MVIMRQRVGKSLFPGIDSHQFLNKTILNDSKGHWEWSTGDLDSSLTAIMSRRIILMTSRKLPKSIAVIL